MDNKTGILLLSHGSKLIDGAQVINAYKDMYIKKYPEAIVEVGYMEIRQRRNIPKNIIINNS